MAVLSAVMLSSTVFADSVIFKKDNGNVELSLPFKAEANTSVMLNVIEQNGDNALTWEGVVASNTDADPDNDKKIVYYATKTADTKGEYNFRFVLTDSGVYKCYFASDDKTEEVTLWHLDETAFAQINEDLSQKDPSNTNEIKTFVDTNRYKFGLFDNLYDKVKADSAAYTEANRILCDYLAQNEYAYTKETVVSKAYAAALINKLSIDNILDYKSSLSFDELGLTGFVKDNYGEELTQKLISKKGTGYADVEKFDKALAEVVVGINIQYNEGTTDIKTLLKKYASEIGVSESVITDNLAASLAGEDDYYDFGSLKNYIINYKEPGTDEDDTPNSSTGGGGGGGGFTGSYAVTEEKEEQQLQNISIFKDVQSSHWAKEYIEALYKEDVISGRTASEFAPEAKITREEYVKLAVSAMELNTIGVAPPFTDVKKNEWYYKFISIAYNSEIINGISETEFGIGLNITRQDLAVITANLLNACKYDFSKNTNTGEFVDENLIADYAKSGVKLLKDAGILNGDENNRFNPNANATRAEAAKIIYMISR